MSEVTRLYKEYEAKVKQIRELCSHERKSDWLDEDAGMMHLTGYQVKICSRCGKEMNRKTTCNYCWLEIQDNEIHKGKGTEGLPFGGAYCKDCLDPKTRIYRCWCGHDAGPRLSPLRFNSHTDEKGNRTCSRASEDEVKWYWSHREP